jgi:hypothetical protein
MDFKPIRFIAELVQVEFDRPPFIEKKPICPDRFIWGEQTYHITETLSQWFDYQRRGAMAHNMTPAHKQAAERRGSRGVGRFYFRVRTREGRVFDLYYDRAVKNVFDTKGNWFLFKELSIE